MGDIAFPLIYALFLWWFATGCLFALNMLPEAARRWSLALATPIAAIACWGLLASGHETGRLYAYLSFTCGLALWAWQTLAYYSGAITGPRQRACPRHARGWARFGYGLAASLWHELAALGMGIALIVAVWHLPNRIGLWTYLLLWTMHVSAKLNLFLGVRNANDDFLPAHLAYLKSFFRHRRMNLLFPLSVVSGSLVTALCLDTALAVEADDFTTAGFTLVATLSGLAVIEHAFLFLPIPTAILWRWSQRAQAANAAPGEAPDSATSTLSGPHATPCEFTPAADGRGRR